jgi:hypothetical protein
VGLLYVIFEQTCQILGYHRGGHDEFFLKNIKKMRDKLTVNSTGTPGWMLHAVRFNDLFIYLCTSSTSPIFLAAQWLA